MSGRDGERLLCGHWPENLIRGQGGGAWCGICGQRRIAEQRAGGAGLAPRAPARYTQARLAPEPGGALADPNRPVRRWLEPAVVSLCYAWRSRDGYPWSTARGRVPEVASAIAQALSTGEVLQQQLLVWNRPVERAWRWPLPWPPQEQDPATILGWLLGGAPVLVLLGRPGMSPEGEHR